MGKALPIRRAQVKVAAFAAWLADNGAEVGTPSNPYEVVRYRAFWKNGARPTTHIIYAKESGLLTFTGGSRTHYERFLEGERLVAPGEAFVSKFDYPQPVEEAGETQGPTARRRKKLLARDGDGCWFCGLPLGNDATLEHLVPQSRGGGNDLANLVLAHAKCNHAAANLSISEKVTLRSEMRSAHHG